ncbi:Homoserine O-acetyltransferase [Hypsizygus marmoreus]|uniref:Homoserine O-acetyltransferase n=1 Tax=Hypsizygus marmoreus TaxID=39966 RepID=A0A369K139_HYPMA|nr:Homoserine O-acetyltransferase [Hypsizygus marmoreus]
MSAPLITLDQAIHVVPSFTLECGEQLLDAPVAYKTWGKLNAARDNVMIICHALTGSADVQDWWGLMMGRGKAFDPARYFIFCGNVLGSPYGSASPLTINPRTGKPYGPSFPSTTIRDDVRIHKLVLDHLGVSSVAVVIGGSMGGMAVLEWPLCTPTGYVRHIVPLATSARHSAWCISWGETQRQCVFSDPTFQDGHYTKQPAAGLAAARMAAMLTYRSRDSFESRFGRRRQAAKNVSILTPPPSPPTPANRSLEKPNDAVKALESLTIPKTTPTIFSAQSYLRYQGNKFIARFDANCFIHITHKMDTHDIARDRTPEGANSHGHHILATLPPRALVIGVSSDGLFTPAEQLEIATHIPDADLVMLTSSDGHDGFLLEFEQMNEHILKFLHRELPELYEGGSDDLDEPIEGFEIQKTSVFGEAEVDMPEFDVKVKELPQVQQPVLATPIHPGV